ncbi:hypothetical protein ACHAWO_009321 [Cyclotella atomus]|uniref:Pentacotripeptide-repeat region of PRORP domain-containing protein n=1 Tax=Cyclotella atomus TaxID=382360 RepID=A0ABD3MRJ0_9STRA
MPEKDSYQQIYLLPASLHNLTMSQRQRQSFSTLQFIIYAHVLLLFSLSNAWTASPRSVRRIASISTERLGHSQASLNVPGNIRSSIRLHSSQNVEAAPLHNERAASISIHIHASKQSNGITARFANMERAESELLQWADDYRKRINNEDVEKPYAGVFHNVISGILALPKQSTSDPTESVVSIDHDEAMDQLRTVMKQSKRTKLTEQHSESSSARATRLLDLMESLHEPLGLIYDEVIASHCMDALEYLQSSHTNTGEEAFNYAWKSAKSALALLNRSEELYRETGESIQLPSISSYISLMDVWKAIAVKSEENSNVKRREEALDTVKSLHIRRMEVYSFNPVESDGVKGNHYNLLPMEITVSDVQVVLQYASEMLHKAEPSYPLPTFNDSIGTWHFNQLIFDLAKYPQSFSGPLAQDLLEYMVATVKLHDKATNDSNDNNSDTSTKNNPIVPKPNTDTINGVLKAWMVTPRIDDAARRAEAVLAQLAIWQSEGTLWSVSPDIVSYNTVISCWKESGIPGSAARSTEILTLLEANTTDISPDEITYGSCIGAWAEAAYRGEKGAVRRAEEILTRMYQRSKADPLNCRAPNTRCFNAILLACANGREKGGGKRALDLLRFMERLQSEGYDDVQPDSYTLNIVVKALTNCGEEGAAEKANEILKRMEGSKDDGRLKADLFSYNSVLDALAKKGDAVAAEALLNQMYKRAKRESGAETPNAFSYTAVLSAYARHEDKATAVNRAEALVNDLETKWASGETDSRPDTSVYNALINCWAKSGDKKTLYRVTQILDLMEELGLQGGDSDVMPNSRTYCAVLDALSRSKNWKAYNESLNILDRMEELYAEGYESVRPCVRAYSIVISTIARSRKKGKAIKAQEVLHRMENEYRKGNTEARPNVYSYNAVLNAAAHTPRGDEKEQEEAFKVACLTFDQLRMSAHLKPTNISYGTFLKAIKNHMPSSDVRDDLVKSVFRRCCRDGQVGTLVLRNMKHLASAELYQSLLEGESNFDLPKSWSVNVKEAPTLATATL